MTRTPTAAPSTEAPATPEDNISDGEPSALRSNGTNALPAAPGVTSGSPSFNVHLSTEGMPPDDREARVAAMKDALRDVGLVTADDVSDERATELAAHLLRRLDGRRP